MPLKYARVPWDLWGKKKKNPSKKEHLENCFLFSCWALLVRSSVFSQGGGAARHFRSLLLSGFSELSPFGFTKVAGLQSVMEDWGRCEACDTCNQVLRHANRYLSATSSLKTSLLYRFSPSFVPSVFYASRPRGSLETYHLDIWLLEWSLLLYWSNCQQYWTTQGSGDVVESFMRRFAFTKSLSFCFPGTPQVRVHSGAQQHRCKRSGKLKIRRV